MHALQSPGPTGRVFTVAAMSRGGRGVSEPDAILDGVASSLALPWIQKRLRKLAGAGGAEQYLFVKVDNDVWGWTAWQQLVDSDSGLPSSPPEVPEHLDGLWFWSSMNRSCVRWLFPSWAESRYF